MKFSAPAKALLAALAPCVKIIERKPTIPILSHVLIEPDDGGLRITANNLDMTYSAKSQANVEPGAAAKSLPAHLLHDILRKVPAEADVALDIGEAQAILRAGRARFQLQTLPAADYPRFDEKPFTRRLTMKAVDFAALIGAVEFSMSTEETRYYLCGIFLHLAEGLDGRPALRMVATDGHRLALAEQPAPDGLEGMPGIIMPRKACAEFARLAADAAGDVEIALSATQMQVAFLTGALTTRLVDGTFPDYQRIIPRNVGRATLNREALAAAVTRVATVSDVRGHPMKLAFAPDGLILSSRSDSAGQAQDHVEVETDLQMEIGFNANYLADMLGVLGGETLTIELDNPGAPTVFRRQDRGDRLCLLMPCRV